MSDFKYHKIAFYMFDGKLDVGHVLRALAWYADHDGVVSLSFEQISESINGQYSKERIVATLHELRTSGLLKFEGDPATFAWDGFHDYTLNLDAMKAVTPFYKAAR